MTDEGAAALEVHEPVEEVPGAPAPRRGSKWDPVIDRVIEAANAGEASWVPVTKPPTFTNTTAAWLRERNDGLLVEVRSDKVYLKWDPAAAAKLRTEAKAKSMKAEHEAEATE